MYGLPGSLIQFGAKRAKKKPGRKSDWSKFVEKQRDLFPVDLYTSKLSANAQTARGQAGRPQRGTSEDVPAAASPSKNQESVYVRVHARSRALVKLYQVCRQTEAASE